ncbi:MAG: hypothetical protein ACOYMA_13485 [Bacteroidia bacterium]
MFLLKKYHFIYMLLLLGMACSVEKSTIPSYIYIKNFRINTDILTQGDTTQDIVDIWLFQNNEFKGSFGLPTYIPITEKDKHNIKLRAGVKRSGQDDQRIQYPMYTDFDTILPLNDLGSDTISPIVSYWPNCKFPLLQDFDGNSSFFSIIKPNPGDSIAKVNDNDAWKINNNSAKFILADTTYRMFYASKELSNLPANNIPLYLEVDYKCNDAFSIGINPVYIGTGTGSTIEILKVKSTNGNWKKLYLDLSLEIGTEIARNGDGTKFQIFFMVQKSGDPLIDNTHLFIDNIKLIHF